MADLEPLAVARLLAAVVAREAPHMLLMGKQAVDDDSNQTVGDESNHMVGDDSK